MIQKTFLRANITEDIKVGKQCFTGADTKIVLDVEIVNNCILGAGSILTSSMHHRTVHTRLPLPVKFIYTTEGYSDKAIHNNTIRPRKREAKRSKLESYVAKHLPYNYINP